MHDRITPIATTNRNRSSGITMLPALSAVLWVGRIPGIPIRLPAGFHRISQVLSLPADRIPSAINPLRRVLAQILATLFQKVRSFTGFVLEIVACFGAGLGGEEHPETDTNTQAQKKARKCVFI